jgi:hypothetical protein
MKRVLAVCFVVLRVMVEPLHALNLPVAEDTFTPTGDTLTKAAGAGTTLRVAPDREAFLRFEAGEFSESAPAETVTRAQLILYFSKVVTPGALTLHTVTSDWTEAVSRATAKPSFASNPFATIPASRVVGKQFVIVDVTEQTKAWLRNPASDFGFAVGSSEGAKVLLGAKEGAASGYSATLEIESTPVISDTRLSSGIDPAKLGAGNVDDAEFSTLDGITSPLQPQLNQLSTDLDGLSNSIALTLQPRLTRVELNVAGLSAGLSNLRNTVTLTLQPQIALLQDAVGAQSIRLDEVSSQVTLTLQPQIASLEGDVGVINVELGRRVNKAGDTMTGPLNLPPNGITVGNDQLVVNSGRVGVGTSAPTAALDVRGDLKIGAAGQLFAPGGEENLRIIRGTIRLQATGLAISAGSGFSIGRAPNGDFVITFTTPFNEPPTLTVSATLSGSRDYGLSLFSRSVSATGATINPGSNFTIPENFPSLLHFIAIGPR